MSRQTVAEGVRITKVGMWYIAFSVIVGLAATNTGNNSLYMVLATMLAVLIVSSFASRSNVRGLRVEIDPPGEVYANTPFPLHFNMRNTGLLPRWLLLFSLERDEIPALVPRLARKGRFDGVLKLMISSRGRHQLLSGHLRSLFPLGFFRKGLRHRLNLDFLVYPELFPAASCHLEQVGSLGEEPKRRAGWGHDLHSLRVFRPGDDPRAIHWKQTARTGSMIYREHKAEESRRLSILLDNAVGKLRGPEAIDRFERLVSEAATAAVDYLKRGYDVELVTRDRQVAFGGGERQRLAILETLALIETRPRTRRGLPATDARVPQLRLVLEGQESSNQAVEEASS